MGIEGIEEILVDLTNGSSSAFQKIYSHFCNKVFNFAKKFLKEDEDSKDVVQEVFIKLWNSKENIDPYRPIEGYIFQITKNTSLNKLRKKIGEPAFFYELDEELPSNKYADEHIFQKEIQETINKIISRLPPKRQEVFRLSREKGLSNREIAEKLGISINTVEGHIRHANSYVRQSMEITSNWSFSKIKSINE